MTGSYITIRTSSPPPPHHLLRPLGKLAPCQRTNTAADALAIHLSTRGGPMLQVDSILGGLICFEFYGFE
jgi:hypothetical protein